MNLLARELAKKLRDRESAIARVRELHRPCSDPHLHDGGRCCLECSDYGRQGVVRIYPCDTLNALEGADSDDHQNLYEAAVERAEAAIARVRDVCDLWQRRHDTYIRRPDDIPAIPITAVLRALEGAE